MRFSALKCDIIPVGSKQVIINVAFPRKMHLYSLIDYVPNFIVNFRYKIIIISFAKT